MNDAKDRLASARIALEGGLNSTVAYILGVPQAEIDRVAPPQPRVLIPDSVARRRVAAIRRARAAEMRA